MTERLNQERLREHRSADSRDPQPAAPQAAPAHGPTSEQAPDGGLLRDSDLETISRRWHDVQAGFVDQPQQAVKDADALVGELMERIARTFADERRQLESHWSRGDQVSTEDLRVSLQRYRTFFQRLLSVH